jgi:hypothetical protein
MFHGAAKLERRLCYFPAHHRRKAFVTQPNSAKVLICAGGVGAVLRAGTSRTGGRHFTIGAHGVLTDVHPLRRCRCRKYLDPPIP